MAIKYLYGGTELVDGTTIRKGKTDGLDSVADGSVGAGQVIVYDPTGVLVFDQWQTWAVEEDACSRSRSWTGVIANATINRADYIVGTQRAWTLDLFDLNSYLHRQVLRLASAKRPRESADARIAWLLGSEALAGVVFDNGLIESNPWLYDEDDTRGKYADDVLATLAANSVSDDAGAVSCVIWVPTAPSGQEATLFYNHASSTTETATISLSNRDADVNNTTCFWVHPDPPLERKGEDIYCGVYFTTQNGSIYRHSATTHAAWFSADDIHRDGTFSTDRISLGATAEDHARKWLAYHSGLRETLTVVAKLTAAAVNLIDAGMRVFVTLVQHPGFETGAYVRVQRRGLPIIEGRNAWYNVRLELSVKGVFDPGGGGTGGFPYVPPGPTAIVQQIQGKVPGGGTLTLPNPPAVGNTLVSFVTARAGTVQIATDVAWTEHPHGLIGVTSTFGDSARMAHRPVAAGDTATIKVVDSGGWCQLWEISGLPTVDASGFANHATTTEPTTVDAGSLTTTVADLILAGICVQCSDWGGNGDTSVGNDASYTTDGKYEVNDVPDTTQPFTADTAHPLTWAGHYSAAAAGSYTPTLAVASESVPAFNFGGWGGLQLAFTASLAGANPPASGKRVPWAVVTVTPGSTTSTGTTLFPYATGTLEVKVDGLLISTASYTETDPTTGAFTLNWVIDTSEVVTVTYLAR